MPPFVVSSISEVLLYSTIRITARLPNGSTSSGTGFFVEIARTADQSAIALVTNKHVIEGADRIEFGIHIKNPATQGPSGAFHRCAISMSAGYVVFHSKENVDLCCIYMQPLFSTMEEAGHEPFYRYVTLNKIPQGDAWNYLDPIEDLTMVGCPNGIFDTHNNLPIVRSGKSSSDIRKNYEGRNEFLVDMACFPGSSGSPIFIYNKIGYLDRKENAYYADRSRILLVGILYAGPLHEVQVNDGRLIGIGTALNMMHLGQAIRATELSDLTEQVLKQLSEV